MSPLCGTFSRIQASEALGRRLRRVASASGTSNRNDVRVDLLVYQGNRSQDRLRSARCDGQKKGLGERARAIHSRPAIEVG